MAAVGPSLSMHDFLHPLSIDLPKVVALAASLSEAYRRLAAESDNQFLSTPISDSTLSPSAAEGGRYLAIDVGGTNLRVGFIELAKVPESGIDLHRSITNGVSDESSLERSRVRRSLEKSWPIGEYLKNEKAEDLFAWIGDCIAEVVEDGVGQFGNALPTRLPMGVTFSFPMIQHTLSDATLMSMGKGFTITSNLDLGKQLRDGYSKARTRKNLPDVQIVAIVNDTVATLISFAHQIKASTRRRAAMGLIVGTGNNATIPLKLSSLNPGKRLKAENIAMGDATSLEEKILVNTEWSINGTAGPLRELDLITRWDKSLDDAGILPGFQPFEYMTAGRYLGELGRLIILDYLQTQLLIPEERLPAKLRKRDGLTSTFLGKFRRHSHPNPSMVDELSLAFPPNSDLNAWHWTHPAADAVFHIAKAIQVRAAGMTAAAIIGLLICADELVLDPNDNNHNDMRIRRGDPSSSAAQVEELVVGYTGGTIVHFQDYLKDCQCFLDDAMRATFLRGVGEPPLRVVLEWCRDGGTVGAGVLAATVHKSSSARGT